MSSTGTIIAAVDPQAGDNVDADIKPKRPKGKLCRQINRK